MSFPNGKSSPDLPQPSEADEQLYQSLGLATFGRYQNLGHIGSGSFGNVFKVWDRRLECIVALKTLQNADEASLFRFKREFRELVDISHRNLVPLYELRAKEDGKTWFFTMELVEGIDFVNYVRGPDRKHRQHTTEPNSITALELGLLRQVLRQLAQGLHALHSAKLLHRDIKPSNVLVDDSGRLFLLDFGLVKKIARGAALYSNADQLAGTPAYMSPEQAAEGELTEASDWYSVGVMLFEALTGRLPFVGGFAKILRAKLEGDARSPQEEAPSLPDDLSQLCRELLARQAEQRPSGEQVLERLGAEAVPGFDASPEGDVPFVGRKQHLEQLSEFFEISCRGQVVAAFIGGGSGFGKTALVRHFLRRIESSRRRPLILEGKCHAQEAVPYKGLDALIDELCRFLEKAPPEMAESLTPRNIQALARIFPVLRQILAVEKSPRDVLEIRGEQEQKRQAMSALRELLRRLSERRPLVLWIDDLQWGDDDSAQLLAKALQPLDPPPLLLICCYRHEELEDGPPLRQLLMTSPYPIEQTVVRDLEVGPLNEEEARKLALALLDKSLASQADGIADESEGSPFFVTELVRAVQGEESNGGAISGATRRHDTARYAMKLDRAISKRADRLSPGPRRLLDLVAIAGQPLELEAAVRAADLSIDPNAAVRLLRDQRFLRADGGEARRLVTYHDRIREALVASLEPDELRQYYRKLARSLDALDVDERADAETLARFYRRSGEHQRAAELAIDAAKKASEALAFDRAARLYRTAIDSETVDPELRHRLQIKRGDALYFAGRYTEAAQTHLEAAAGTAGLKRVELQLRVAEEQSMSGEIVEGRKTLETVLESIGAQLPKSRLQVQLSSILIRWYLRLKGIRFQEQEAAEVPRDLLTRIDVCYMGFLLVVLYDAVGGFYLNSRQLLWALRAGEPHRAAVALAMYAVQSAFRGTRSQDYTERLLQEALVLAKRVNHPLVIATTTFCSGFVSAIGFKPGQAFDQMEKAREIFREKCTGSDAVSPGGLSRPLAMDLFDFYIREQQIYTLLKRGRLGEVRRRLPELLNDAKGQAFFQARLRSGVTWILLLAADRPDAARDELGDAKRLRFFHGFSVTHVSQLRGRVYVALYRDKPEEAMRALEETAGSLRRSQLKLFQNIRMSALGLRSRAALAVAKDDPGAPQAAKLLEPIPRYLRQLERENPTWSRPPVQLVRAGLATLEGRRDEALELLASAEAGFESTERDLHVAVCRLRRGQLLEYSEGRELVRQSTGWMTEQGIRNVERMAGMLAPGRWS